MSKALWEQTQQRLQSRGDTIAPAVVTATDTLTGDALVARVSTAASLLPSKMPGRARVAVCQTDPLDGLITILAAWSRDMVPIVIREQLPQPAVDALVAAAGAAATINDAGWQVHLNPASQDGALAPSPEEALIIPTSGTTGAPKLAALPVESLYRNAVWIAEDLGIEAGDRVLVAQPMSHAYGLIGGCLMALLSDAQVHLRASSTPPPKLQNHIREHDITVVQGSPSFWRLFATYAGDRTFETIRLWTTASEAPGRALINDLAAVLPNARGVIGYGMTEAGPRVSHVDAADAAVDVGCVGHVAPHLDWKLVPAGDDGNTRLALRGPSMFLGYILDGGYRGYAQDGYYHASDLISEGDDGRLFYRGRADFRVKVSGHLVNPEVTEQLVLAMPGVRDAVCIAEPHRILGHQLRLEVVLAADAALDADRIREHCRSELEPSLVPRRVEIVDAISRTAGGKRARQSIHPS